MTDSGWQLLGALVRRRRERLGLNQSDLATYGGPRVSTVGKMERGEQGNYPPRTRQQVEVALGWRRGAVDLILEAPGSAWWSDAGQRADFIASLVDDDLPDLTRQTAPRVVRSAADLTDDELLAELTYRMKRYATERQGESGGDTAANTAAGSAPAEFFATDDTTVLPGDEAGESSPAAPGQQRGRGRPRTGRDG